VITIKIKDVFTIYAKNTNKQCDVLKENKVVPTSCDKNKDISTKCSSISSCVLL
jgi:hypothetical protein